jgi:hypothetical protein
MFTQNPQTAGIAALTGTYVFDLRTCNRTLSFNRFFWNMIRAEHRQAFWGLTMFAPIDEVRGLIFARPEEALR